MRVAIFLVLAVCTLAISCNSSKDILRHDSGNAGNLEGFASGGGEMEDEELAVASRTSKFDSTLVKQAEEWMKEPLPQRQTKEIKYPIGLEPGNLAPNIILPDPEGKEYALWDMEGKMVILDFWASWCAPCRANNTRLSELYNKYRFTQFTRGRGLTVYSVSLDNRRDAWTKAIERDNVPWPYHVSDLQGWESMIALDYSLRQLPSYYLLDREGVVIAQNITSITELESLIAAYKL